MNNDKHLVQKQALTKKRYIPQENIPKLESTKTGVKKSVEEEDIQDPRSLIPSVVQRQKRRRKRADEKVFGRDASCRVRGPGMGRKQWILAVALFVVP